MCWTKLGQSPLLLPALVAAGLEANDRAKYLLTLLQACVMKMPTCQMCPLSPFETSDWQPGSPTRSSIGWSSARAASGTTSTPSVGGHVHAALVDAIGEMLAPLEADRSRAHPTGTGCERSPSRVPSRAATSFEAATSIA